MRAKAIAVIEPGRVELSNIDVDEPKAAEVLVKTEACGICMGDVHAFAGRSRTAYPAFIGHEGVGTVVSMGDQVVDLKPGDRVTTLGGPAFAEYYKTVEGQAAKLPEGVEKPWLWISEPAACAVNGVRGANVEIGDDVCVVGCGYMGLLLLQALPKSYTGTLIAVDLDDHKLMLAKRFGAEVTLNPRRSDVLKETRSVLGRGADVVFEAAGVRGTISLATGLARNSGTVVIFGHHVEDEMVPTSDWHTRGLRVLNTAPQFSPDFTREFRTAVKLMRRGVFNQEPLMTHIHGFDEAQEAFQVAQQRPRGYVKGVIRSGP